MSIPSRSSQYAWAMLLEIANNAPRPVAVYSMSSGSLAYREQLQCKMKKAGITTSERGPGGGLLLAIPADQITMGMVVQSIAPRRAEPTPEKQSGHMAEAMRLALEAERAAAAAADRIASVTLAESLAHARNSGLIEAKRPPTILKPVVKPIPQTTAANSIFALGERLKGFT